MAMLSFPWMREDPATIPLDGVPNVGRLRGPTGDSGRDHVNWPRNSTKEASMLSLRVLEQYLQTKRGTKCKIYRYIGTRKGGDVPSWVLHSKPDSAAEIEDLLRQDGEDFSTTFYLVSRYSSEAIRLLGYHLDLPPRFFDPSYVVWTISPRAEKSFVYFRVQFVEKWDSGTSDSNNAPIMFRPGSQWRFTDIGLLCTRRSQEGRFDALCLLNPEDETISEGFRKLLSMDTVARSSPSSILILSLANEALRIVALHWGVFLDEAEAHTADISSRCIGPQSLSTEDQLHYTRNLHQLTPLWGQVLRRLSAACNIIQSLPKHEFYKDMTDGEENSEFLLKIKSTMEEHQERTKALREQTTVLISLSLNIAMLNEATATMQETKASHNLGTKLHRITIITFIFFPLSISMSVFSMNIRQMTGNATNPDITTFAILAVALISVTALLWLLWFLLDRRHKEKVMCDPHEG